MMDGSDAPFSDAAAAVHRNPVPAVGVTDAQGSITGWSREACLLLGYSAAEVAGQQVAAFLTGDFRTFFERRLAEQDDWTGPATFQHRNGSALDLFVSMKRLDSGDDKPQWLLTAHPPKDVCDAHSILDLSFTQSPVSQVIFDTELRFTLLNDAARSRLGMADRDIIGRRVNEVFSDPVYAAHQRHLRQVLETGEPVHYEGYYRMPGVVHERPWAHEMGPVRDPSGRMLGVVVTTYESSEQYWGRRRWSLLNEAGTRIGTSLDVSQTASELAATVVPNFADFASVDLLESVAQGHDATLDQLTPPLALRRIAHHSGHSPHADRKDDLGRIPTGPEIVTCAIEVTEPIDAAAVEAHQAWPAPSFILVRDLRVGVRSVQRWGEVLGRSATCRDFEGTHEPRLVAVVER